MAGKGKIYIIITLLNLIGGSRRDDVLAVLYILKYLKTGTLPWNIIKFQ